MKASDIELEPAYDVADDDAPPSGASARYDYVHDVGAPANHVTNTTTGELESLPIEKVAIDDALPLKVVQRDAVAKLKSFFESELQTNPIPFQLDLLWGATLMPL